MNLFAVQLVDVCPARADIRTIGAMTKQDMASTSGGIRSNLAWMVTGTVWSGACQWALLIVLTKLGTVDMVGTFTLSLAIAFPVLMFSCLNLRNLYVTDYSGAYRFREYLALRLLMAAASVLLIVAFAAANGYSRGLVLAIGLIGLAKAVEYISDILYGLPQRQESMAAMSLSLMVRATLSFGALTAGVYLSGSLIWGLCGLVLSSFVTLLLFDIPVTLAFLNLKLFDAWKDLWQYATALFAGSGNGYRRLRSLALAGAPLGLVLMLVSLNINIPRYFVERSFGLREQGIFSSLANLVAAGSVVVGAFGQSATPRLARYFATGDMRAFRALLWTLVLTSLGLGAAGLLLASAMGRDALTIIYRPEYAARRDIFVWLMAASGAIYLGSTLGVALTAVRCLTPQLPLFVLAATSTALTCYFLVPTMGLKGAAVSIFVSAMIQCTGGVWLLRRVCKSRGLAATAA